jgi:hypothetical protein
MGETNMGRYRNPRYAPEFLERKLSPTAFVAPAPLVFVPTAAPVPADTNNDTPDASATDFTPDASMFVATNAASVFPDGGSGSGGGGSGSGSSSSGDGDGWGPDGEPPFLPPAYLRSGPAVAY